jgi:Methyltransferase domain
MTARANSSVLDRLVWCSRAARLALEDPVEGLDRALLRLVRRGAEPIQAAEADPAWEIHLHTLLDAPWPCRECSAFEGVYETTTAQLEAQGLDVGRGAFGGWDDADPAFARAVWCLAVHLHPTTVVETGVARGVTTRIILEALDRSEAGHLWSIDRPPLDRDLHSQIGAAVPATLRRRWTLVRGTSRRMLPSLLGSLGQIDLFVHDSLHSQRNLSFELTRAWGAMRGAGALAADDVNQNAAFRPFVSTVPALAGIVAPADDGHSLFGVAVPQRAPARWS